VGGKACPPNQKSSSIGRYFHLALISRTCFLFGVVRRVTSTFWFIREVMQYAPDCVIVSPENVRSLVKEKLKSLCHKYDLEVHFQDLNSTSN
jgi:predicted DNA-binding transcriptional regulator YafY